MQTALGCTAKTYDCCYQPQTSCKAPDYNGNFPCKIGTYVPGSGGGVGTGTNVETTIIIGVVGAIVVLGAICAYVYISRGGSAEKNNSVV